MGQEAAISSFTSYFFANVKFDSAQGNVKNVLQS